MISKIVLIGFFTVIPIALFFSINEIRRRIRNSESGAEYQQKGYYEDTILLKGKCIVLAILLVGLVLFAIGNFLNNSIYIALGVNVYAIALVINGRIAKSIRKRREMEEDVENYER